MVVDFYVENFFYRFFDRLDARIAEFDDFARIGHDDVVVLLVEIGFFVMRLVLPELMLPDQSAVEQQFDRVVQRCAADTIIFVLHFDVEVFYVKMVLAIVNFLQDRIAFRRFAMAFAFEIHRKHIFYDLLILGIIGGNECHGAKISVRRELAIPVGI